MGDALAEMLLSIDDKPGEVLTADILRGAMERLRMPPLWDDHHCKGWLICEDLERHSIPRPCVTLGLPCVDLEVAARA